MYHDDTRSKWYKNTIILRYVSGSALAHVQEVAELVILGCDEADPARRVLVLSAVLYVHLEKRCESLEEVSKARFVV